MADFRRIGRSTAVVALAAGVLAACGGADDTVLGSAGGTPTAQSEASAADPAAAAASTATAADKSFADRTLEAVNAARAVARKCGTVDYPAVGPLKWNVQAEQAALAHAQYLQQNNLFSHTGANGSTVGARLTATGYVWSTVGENIAAGYVDLATVIQGWLDSPGHCVNLMNGNFVDLGVALVPGTSSNTYRTYWGMVLARPR